MMPGQLPTQLMGLVSNPALAAAAAGQLFPHPAMLANPGAFLAMSEAFAAGMQQAAGQQVGQTTQGMMMPPLANMMGTTQPLASASNNSYALNSATTMNPNQPAATPSHLMQSTVPSLNSNNQAMVLEAPSTTMIQPQISSFGGSSINTSQDSSSAVPSTPMSDPASVSSAANGRGRRELTAAERARQNRDRNREHARSTRLRKKAYVQKLKELVEGLHAERSEEVRKRRVAMQHLAEVQGVRRSVVRSFLQFHAGYESDPRKWSSILEDNFWFKQPITPYRSFRRGEIEQVSQIIGIFYVYGIGC